jgi:uncharacterized repeat protein (TIGR03803 family)
VSRDELSARHQHHRKALRILTVAVCAAFPGAACHAATLTNLHSFAGSADGAVPGVALIQGSDGSFYGTTGYGGTNGNGTVFKITSAGTVTTLYAFAGPDGGYPFASLVQGSDGNFYGTTFQGGGTNLMPSATGYGSVFKITSAGTLTPLHTFTGPDGAYLSGQLVQGSDGYFYGTTQYGGTNGDCGAGGCGTVFRMSQAGTVTLLYNFTKGADGAFPPAGLVQGSDSNFYGTTFEGGMLGQGAMFRITTAGTLTPLHGFGDGSPAAALVRGGDGFFYGTTSVGGTNNAGTVFRISSSGTFTDLHQFSGPDGSNPYAGLVQGSDGNFYGTTYTGGTNNIGTVFRVNPSGTFQTLYQFSGPDGSNPYAGLVQGSDGDFYGVTSLGGASGTGAVFQLFVPLNPPANQISAIQAAGGNVILGVPSVSGETYQLQASASLIGGIWSNVPGVSVLNGVGGPLVLTNATGALPAQQFYRMAITP